MEGRDSTKISDLNIFGEDTVYSTDLAEKNRLDCRARMYAVGLINSVLEASSEILCAGGALAFWFDSGRTFADQTAVYADRRQRLFYLIANNS